MFDFFYYTAKKKDCITNPQLKGLGEIELPVLALSSGIWGGKDKGERNETAGWHERNGMKESTLAGVAEAGG